MDAVGLIPARGGSKAIPRKNLAPVCGRPLIAWTIEAARESETLSRVVVSTDSDEIADAAVALGAEVLRRPPELAADDTPMAVVVAHAIDHLAPVDALVLLQPTSPLRRARHIDEAVALLESTCADCVVSVVEVPHRYVPSSLMRVDGDRLTPLHAGGPVLRQQKERLVARNGPAVLALRAASIGEDLYGGDCRAYLMDERESIDVDGALDLELADYLLRTEETQ